MIPILGPASGPSRGQGLPAPTAAAAVPHADPARPDAPASSEAVDLREHTHEILWAATRAPSYRDLQPWSFRDLQHQGEVYADLSRSCPVADPVDRQLFLGLGAAVLGVRPAVARLGLRPIVGITATPACRPGARGPPPTGGRTATLTIDV